jgi:hypothetical protein
MLYACCHAYAYAISLGISANDFHNALAKKKDSEAVDQAEKLSAIDALGLVMITHGEEFGEESAYGTNPFFIVGRHVHSWAYPRTKDGVY